MALKMRAEEVSLVEASVMVGVCSVTMILPLLLQLREVRGLLK